MNWNTIRAELARLTALAEGWCDGQPFGSLERDLMLEKLRKLYEEIRFAESAEQPAQPAVQPESEPVAPVVDPEEAQPEVEAAPEPVAAPEIASAEPEPAAEPAGQADEEPDAAAEPEPEVETEAGPDSEPVRKNTLFDPEEDEAMQHRRKQRVIMSLYGAAPEEPAPAPDPDPQPAKWNGLVEHIEHPDRPLRPESDSLEETVTFEEVSVETVVMEDPLPVIPVEEEQLPEMQPEPIAVPETETESETATEPETEPMPVFEPEPEAVAEPLAQPDPTPEPDDASAPVYEPESESFAAEPEPAVGAPVLGEVINHDVQTLADTIEAPRSMVSDLLRHETITDLRQAIGLNDKFLLIRDLFGGDSQLYETIMQKLNAFDNLDDCMIYIAENHTWNPNSESVRVLMDLLERKFA